ncbi:asparagine synthase [candidate division MSBL1 archaeon SCGC-AAA382M17]|uniref:Asparagine synthase n=1 Tax=candidate division MSBL1 archaeon SCGC-AAA382M17 TaxID=1698284 RepID=A0ABR5TJJ6_9EURY|nr:asparagine synthase [candidate division MSBL1 archaeon SCGC-AAA382M17]
MKKLIIPKDYQNLLSREATEGAIKFIKDEFQNVLASKLGLSRVTAPMLVIGGTGINDDLNGVEKPVSFPVYSLGNTNVEVVQSLAKWKRLKLAQLNGERVMGIYADMNALRPDEELGNLHSVYVDQWDWEKVISAEERNLDKLKDTVRKIYEAIRINEEDVSKQITGLKSFLPKSIKFIHAEELRKKYPNHSPRERENLITREYRAVFVIGIGYKLSDGKPHDGRAPDYDDWSTPTENGNRGLNGDILVWNPVLEQAFEISSMGIRVNKDSLLEQLKITGTEERKELLFHRKLLNDELPLTMGGGIGQSRLCMLYLRKAHIGEVQACVWPKEMREECEKNNIKLL